ncbi:hypothetical protein CABS03_08117 [Colletotrichum abscissum]|uniref:Uncharacterized protein n=1 Tax=Colletotrichum abscissum TaxID=1671311 RepID=A0A9P9XCR4_9PEZI|nr:hypothetical protein CABS02_07895 [Colletotrichum abscissum]
MRRTSYNMVLRFTHNPGCTLFTKTAKALWVVLGGGHLTWARTLSSLHVGGQMILALFYLCVGRYGSIDGVVCVLLLGETRYWSSCFGSPGTQEAP